MTLVTAAEIARKHGLDPKQFRQALRDANFSWYVWGARWTVEAGSTRHEDMLDVLRRLTGGRTPASSAPFRSQQSSDSRIDSDEGYVIDLCDAFLGQKAARQHCFDFLRGDEGSRGTSRMLPVDARYPQISLVIEYRERQHSEAVQFFDRKETVSGMSRGDQRRLYDQRRREVLPVHGINLVEFDFFDFSHGSNRRLRREAADADIVAQKLGRFVKSD